MLQNLNFDLSRSNAVWSEHLRKLAGSGHRGPGQVPGVLVLSMHSVG